MSSSTKSMTTTQDDRLSIGAMYAGLGLTVIGMTVPYVDRGGLAAHIRAGYPAYTHARVDAAATTYLIYLSVVGVLGIVCWLGTIWAVRAGKGWARGVATAIFAAATIVALTDLLIKDTSGATGLPPLLGWIGILPCLAGLLAVGLLWRRSWPVLAPTHKQSHSFALTGLTRNDPNPLHRRGDKDASTND